MRGRRTDGEERRGRREVGEEGVGGIFTGCTNPSGASLAPASEGDKCIEGGKERNDRALVEG